MDNFFLFTTEIAGKSAAIKFEAKSRHTTIFKVTVLTEKSIRPFTINMEKGTWCVNADGCLLIKSIEGHLIDAARRFTEAVESD